MNFAMLSCRILSILQTLLSRIVLADDTLDSILSELGNKHDDRSCSFHWTDVYRRHDRRVEEGWAWDGEKDNGGYRSEQILTTSPFRTYLCMGGRPMY